MFCDLHAVLKMKPALWMSRIIHMLIHGVTHNNRVVFAAFLPDAIDNLIQEPHPVLKIPAVLVCP